MPMESSGGGSIQQQEIWQPGTEVLANYDFRGTTKEDLPFTRGDVLTIVKSTRDVNWYKAKSKTGQEGMIPATYVQKRKEVSLHAMPWHHGAISRDEAEDLLRGKPDGVYLVRDSVHFHGDFTLSISCDSRIDHYRILTKNNELEVDGGDCTFDNLIQLVEASLVCTDMQKDFVLKNFHWNYNVGMKGSEDSDLNKALTWVKAGNGDLLLHYTQDADGLCTRLIQPLQKKGENFCSVSAEDFKSGGWTVDKQDLVTGELIGKGEFGEVLKGLYQGKPVAVKKLKDTDRAAQAFLKEASLMTLIGPLTVELAALEHLKYPYRFTMSLRSVRHPNLVALIGIVQAETIYLLLEYMGKGNLAEFLRTRGRAVITKKDQINYATDTCCAMAYLESRKLVHRDLAARNVLLNDEGTAKVSDFGLANHADFNPSGGKFPIKWTAPEALRDNKFTSKSDMWSFGILLWEVYSFGRVPYPRIPLSDVVMHVERGYRMEAPEGCPPETYAIMTAAWAKEPADRPTFEEIRIKLESLKAITV